MTATETIVALSTPVGESALGIIRLSGPLCPALINDLISAKSGLKPRRATLHKYFDINGLELDTVIFIAYEEGASFTGEALLEIMPHGNPLIVQKILEDLIGRGCRIAEPGEFTKRAFLNGKMDLSQAEAVADIIHARSSYSLEVARRQLNGSIGKKMSELSEQLLALTAELEAYIDFPEEDLPTEDQAGPARDLKALIQGVEDLVETHRYSALLHDGIKTLIIGAPNAGKSSLINYFVGSERALVSDIAGTTRDFISAFILLDDYRIEIIDTAGLHLAEDRLEQQGIEKTLEIAESADFYLLILDQTQPSPQLPEAIKRLLTEKNTLVIENKQDLDSPYSHLEILPQARHCSISLKEQTGLKKLKCALTDLIEASLRRPKSKDAIVLNARHVVALNQALDALNEASQKIDNQEFSELISADLRRALDGFSQVVGRIDNEAMLDKLFQKFCIGK
ncbi:MAG: tRNA uridine-5-carboxymethylaminomethyl(34) synthesis GTPase MnmE [Puniceicoccaceae bacterium]|nr:MAG: tRNA uridine-5-carboxymethylaminomethyl(34) synthesis GTPase MnmE [Puniceicoccaceae bacterium]